MYLKARAFGDEETAQKILATPNPAHAKELGRQVKNFNSEVWNNVKYELMYLAVYLKFSQKNKLRSELLLDAVRFKGFVECNPKDRIWGIGYPIDEAPSVPEDKWGENLLGKVLMDVRHAISFDFI